MATRRRETEDPLGSDINMGQDRDYQGRSNYNNMTNDSDNRGNKEVTDDAKLDLNEMQDSEERDEMLDKEEEESEDMDDMTADMDDDDDDDFDDDDDEDENDDGLIL